jgi:hypothetical protein
VVPKEVSRAAYHEQSKASARQKTLGGHIGHKIRSLEMDRVWRGK